MPVTLASSSQGIRNTYRRAQEALRKDNADYAVDLFLSMLELEPELAEVRKELRDLQVSLTRGKKANPMAGMKGMGKSMAVKGALKKDPAKALVLAEELLKLDLQNQAFLDTYCEAAEAAGVLSAATITLEAVTKLDPKNDKSFEKLGHMLVKAGDASAARKAFERLGELRPGDQHVIKWIKDTSAMDSMQKGGWEEEGSFHSKLKDEEEATALEQAGKSQQNLSDMDKLIITQKRKLEQEPDNLNLYRPLADTMVKAGMLDEALEVLSQADEMTNHADPLIQRGISEITVKIYQHNIAILQEQGDEAGAQEQEAEMNEFLLEDAADKVARYPNDLGFKFEYGEMLFKTGELDQAIAQFQQAQRNPQHRIDALYLMGRCFKAKGQLDIAADQLRKAAEELPVLDDVKMNVIYELGEVLEEQGEMDQSLDYFKQIYAVDIGYKDVSAKIEAGYERAKQNKA